jgi:hypothetical protein
MGMRVQWGRGEVGRVVRKALRMLVEFLVTLILGAVLYWLMFAP